ncbi:hypothetical protein E2C01_055858 [Portunus trituberculatus]|uniref:Uncharacterized protein n=1 Tax=Portunus trituberculatus TaxID=210409 RepID=A0A5B7GSE2_PORTR|nr:hypothetical protein [Portunus trituberculatus]
MQVRSGERIVQLSQDVVGVPLTLPLETTASPLQGLVYVATNSQLSFVFAYHQCHAFYPKTSMSSSISVALTMPYPLIGNVLFIK